MPLVVLAVAFAVAAAATAIGAAIAQGELDKANAIRKKVLEQYGDDVMPHLDKAIAEEVGPTALAAIKEDPEVRGTQVDVMRKLQEVYQQGGHTQGDEAALQLANMGAQQQSSSDAQSMAQALAARGQRMNPALAAAMAAKSSGDVVNATARNRYQAQADARNRAMQALGMSGSLAGNIRGQDYQQASAAASAQDRINAFNASQRTNAAANNNANAMQMYQAKMGLLNGRADAMRDIAVGHQQGAENARGAAAGVANAAMTTGGAIAGSGGGRGASAPAQTPAAPQYQPTGQNYGGSEQDEWLQYGINNPYLK